MNDYEDVIRILIVTNLILVTAVLGTICALICAISKF
jgi:hypothetical protein